VKWLMEQFIVLRQEQRQRVSVPKHHTVKAYEEHPVILKLGIR
jgi:hypothetical protein